MRNHLQVVCLFWLPFFHYFLLLELLIIIIDFSFPYLASLLQFVDIFNDHVQVLKILRRISNFLLLLPLAHVGCIRVKRVSCRYWVLRNILLKFWIVGDLLPNRTAAWGWVELSDVLLRSAIPDPGGFQLTAYFQKLVLQLLKYLWITKCLTIRLNLLWLKHYKCFGAPKKSEFKDTYLFWSFVCSEWYLPYFSFFLAFSSIFAWCFCRASSSYFYDRIRSATLLSSSLFEFNLLWLSILIFRLAGSLPSRNFCSRKSGFGPSFAFLSFLSNSYL